MTIAVPAPNRSSTSRPGKRSLCALALLLAFCAAPGVAEAANVIATVDANGTLSPYGVGASATSISANGRYVVFSSADVNMVSPSVGTSNLHVFERDLLTGTTKLVSANGFGVPGNSASSIAYVDGDGRYVVFSSFASNLVPGDSNNTYDIFVRDVVGGTTERVNVSSSGAQAPSNTSSYVDSISPDGRYAVVDSDATNLVSDDHNNQKDAFVHDRATGRTWILRVPSLPADQQFSKSGVVSADDRYVVFAVATYGSPTWQIYRQNIQTGVTDLVSIGVYGGTSTAFDYNEIPSVSADGRYITFTSWFQDIAPGITSGGPHVVVRDMVAGQTSVVDVGYDGLVHRAANSDLTLGGQSISGDGRYVLFLTDSAFIVPGDTNRVEDVFLRDLVAGTTTRVNVADDGSQANGGSYAASISADGKHYVFLTRAVNLAANVATAGEAVIATPATTPDTVAPTTVDDAPPGWFNHDVVVHLSATDDSSGVAATYFRVDGGAFGQGTVVTIPATADHANDGTHTIGYYSVDRAGNVEQSHVAAVNIDTTPPTIGGGSAPPPNVDGWNNNSVTVGFSCSDSSSGIASCPTPTTLGEGAGQAVTGTAVDRAGNSATSTVSGINVDKTPPTLTGTPTAAPNEHGWHNAGVTIRWSCSDALSGITTSCPPDSVLIQEGTGLTATASVSDRAGNVQAATSTPVNIDRTAPVTIDDALAGWANHPLDVHLSASDGGSGVAVTYFQVDGGTVQTGTLVTIAAPADHANDGTHTISYYSVDQAGNVEPAHLAAVNIDTTPPSIVGNSAPSPNTDGWNNSSVTVGFTCSDSSSGIDACPTPITLGEGAAQSVTGTAVDRAGNSMTATVSGINVDETSPSLTGTPTSAPNVHGWYNANVTIQWSCSDPLSGIRTSCPPDSVLTQEGAGLTATANVSDHADNIQAATSTPVNIDHTAPMTTALAPTGWTNAGVTVTLSALDNLAGVDSTHYSLDGGATQTGTSITIDTDGIHSLTFWSVDLAGNIELPKTVQILIDRTAPTITHQLSPLPNPPGWNNSDVTVTFSCSDSLSGIQSCTPAQLITSEGASRPVTGVARDNAGNQASDTALVSLDKTPPSIRAIADRPANASGWYNADVQVSFACADTISGVASCPTTTTVGEGAHQDVDGTATDTAGNTALTVLSNLNVDKTPPSVVFIGNAGTYTVDQTVNILCGATDALSGIATTTCSNVNAPAWSFGLGTTSRTASATDLAGNTGTGFMSFTVGVTCASVENVVRQLVGNATIANSLTAKIEGICEAPNQHAKSGKLGAFDNEVAAQTGKALTASQATLLEQLAAAL